MSDKSFELRILTLIVVLSTRGISLCKHADIRREYSIFIPE